MDIRRSPAPIASNLSNKSSLKAATKVPPGSPYSRVGGLSPLSIFGCCVTIRLEFGAWIWLSTFRNRVMLCLSQNVTTRTAPAALGYRMPAEWEPHAATWLSWPRREGISFPGCVRSRHAGVPQDGRDASLLRAGLHQCLQRRARSGSARGAGGLAVRAAHLSSHSDQRTLVPGSRPDFPDASRRSRGWRLSIGITTPGAASIRRAIWMKSSRPG